MSICVHWTVNCSRVAKLTLFSGSSPLWLVAIIPAIIKTESRFCICTHDNNASWCSSLWNCNSCCHDNLQTKDSTNQVTLQVVTHLDTHFAVLISRSPGLHSLSSIFYTVTKNWARVWEHIYERAPTGGAPYKSAKEGGGCSVFSHLWLATQKHTNGNVVKIDFFHPRIFSVQSVVFFFCEKNNY